MSHRKLYDELGVEPDADTSEIKKAYKKKAKKAHPDHDGSEEEFGKLNRAYVVLVDPERRAKYDATGDASESSADNAKSQVMVTIAGALEMVIANLEQRGSDPLAHDIVALMRTKIKEEMSKIEQRIQACDKLIAKTKKYLGKFRVKEGSNFIEQMIEAKITNIGLNVASAKRELAPLQGAYDMLSDVEFSVDKPAEYKSIPLSYFNVGF